MHPLIPIKLSNIDDEHGYATAFEIMRELRPQLSNAAEFIAQALRQREQGYRLLGAWQEQRLVGLAGYRFSENLLYGRFLYVDDLVVSRHSRGSKVGGALIDKVRDAAKQQDCAYLVLDTGLDNSLAQRFYFRQGLLSRGMHFSQAL